MPLGDNPPPPAAAADSNLGCLHVLSSPTREDHARLGSKRKVSFATVTKRDALNTAEKAEKRLRRRASSLGAGGALGCGDLDALPPELLEMVLYKCGARELGALTCSAKYFKDSGIVERVARTRVDEHPRADGVEPRRFEPKPPSAKILHFATLADVATRTAAGLALGAFHTAVLGIAKAVPGKPPSERPVRRRTDAREFAQRQGLDPTGGASNNYEWGPTPSERDAQVSVQVSEEDQRDEHGMSVFAPVAEGFPGASDDSASRSRQFSGFTGLVSRPAARAPWRDDRAAITPEEAAANRANAAPSQPLGRTLYTFGRGFHGQLGQGGYDDAARPAAVDLGGGGRSLVFSDASAIETVACGSSHCAALDPSGALLTWGLASSGELGHGGWTPIEVDVPRRVTSMEGVKVTQVATGANHTVAVTSGGSLWTCGRGRHGQLGHGHFHDAGPLQRLEALRGMRVLHAAAGGSHSLCLTDCGSVWSWGACKHGQLGLGDVAFASAAGWESGVPWPCLVETLNDLDEPVVSISAGGSHTLFVTAGGQLWATGRGRHGALGVGVKGTHQQYYYYEEDQRGAVAGPADHLVPRLVPVHHKPAPTRRELEKARLDEPVDQRTGMPTFPNDPCGGGAFAHGGDSSEGARFCGGSSRTSATSENRGDIRVALAGMRAAADEERRRRRRKRSRGASFRGDAADDATGPNSAAFQTPARYAANAPDAPGALADTTNRLGRYSAQGETEGMTTRRKPSARADADPRDAPRKQRKGDPPPPKADPQPQRWVKAPCSCGVSCRVVHAAAGGNHSCVLTACGAVMTSGSNAYGQLGHGDARRRYAFQRVESLRGASVATVACGEDHTGAVLSGGGLYLWGRGDWGQLGTGDGRSHWKPRAVRGVNVAPPVSAERFLAFAGGAEGDSERTSEEERALGDDPRNEMGGANQHATIDQETAAVYA